MKIIPEYVKIEAQKELARRELWYYCKLRYPNFYKNDRKYLKNICEEIQSFVNDKENKILILNLPPRHGKSFTIKNAVEWLFGHNPKLKIITASYNEILSGMFAAQVRNTIAERKVGNKLVYNDLFPQTKIKQGEASASLWAIEGSQEKSYLATSPTGTSTGFGANIIIVDDLIKNSQEAYNENELNKKWDWFVNTILSRLEGNDWKIMVIMTRWSEDDLAGKLLKSEYKDYIKTVTYPAVQEDGSMLCDEILDENTYKLKTSEMNLDIAEANYNQKLIDVKNRLYGEFKVWEELPKYTKKYNITDTADTGEDYLCSINYVEYQGEAYITEILFTNEPMEITENETADLLFNNNVNVSTIESNSGGRGFARNVERIIKDKYNSTAVVINTKHQTQNKESRILTASAWVERHIYMPLNWQHKYPEFYKHIKNFKRKGKNAHDDGADVLSSIYEHVTAQKATIFDKNMILRR